MKIIIFIAQGFSGMFFFSSKTYIPNLVIPSHRCRNNITTHFARIFRKCSCLFAFMLASHNSFDILCFLCCPPWLSCCVSHQWSVLALITYANGKQIYIHPKMLTGLQPTFICQLSNCGVPYPTHAIQMQIPKLIFVSAKYSRLVALCGATRQDVQPFARVQMGSPAGPWSVANAQHYYII